MPAETIVQDIRRVARNHCSDGDGMGGQTSPRRGESIRKVLTGADKAFDAGATTAMPEAWVKLVVRAPRSLAASYR